MSSLVIEKEGNQMTESQKETIKVMRKSLLGYKKIAEKTGLSPSAIKAYCYRNGLNTEAIKNSAGFCKNCGKPILEASKTRPRLFCCNECKSVWWNKRNFDHKKSQLIITLTCPICGKEYVDYGSAKRKYCSRICFQNRKKSNKD